MRWIPIFSLLLLQITGSVGCTATQQAQTPSVTPSTFATVTVSPTSTSTLSPTPSATPAASATLAPISTTTLTLAERLTEIPVEFSVNPEAAVINPDYQLELQPGAWFFDPLNCDPWDNGISAQCRGPQVTAEWALRMIVLYGFYWAAYKVDAAELKASDLVMSEELLTEELAAYLAVEGQLINGADPLRGVQITLDPWQVPLPPGFSSPFFTVYPIPAFAAKVSVEHEHLRLNIVLNLDNLVFEENHQILTKSPNQAIILGMTLFGLPELQGQPNLILTDDIAAKYTALLYYTIFSNELSYFPLKLLVIKNP